MERVRTGLLHKSQSLFSVTRKQRISRKSDFNETLKSTLEEVTEEGYWETRRFLLGKAELLQLKAYKKKLKVVGINNLEEEPWVDLSNMEGELKTEITRLQSYIYKVRNEEEEEEDKRSSTSSGRSLAESTFSAQISSLKSLKELT